MMIRHDLTQLAWKLTGFQPWQWLDALLNPPASHLFPVGFELPEIPALVPGSVQMALRNAALLPDWNEGLNAKPCALSCFIVRWGTTVSPAPQTPPSWTMTNGSSQQP